MVARLAASLVTSLLVLSGCCRVRSTFDSGATAACQAEGSAPDAGPGAARERCEACCRRRGLSSVEPGYCECGQLGLDALIK